MKPNIRTPLCGSLTTKQQYTYRNRSICLLTLDTAHLVYNIHQSCHHVTVQVINGRVAFCLIATPGVYLSCANLTSACCCVHEHLELYANSNDKYHANKKPNCCRETARCYILFTLWTINMCDHNFGKTRSIFL